ncbi:MAG TPA: LppX_LprAFG lipoprotein [Gaiellaceae bacterium]|nr:LppX_LprAFG lipoprotein [Gaiellaceae bacterium]
MIGVVRKSRRTGIAAAVAIAAVAVVSAGCGGGGASSALSLDPVANAATKTQQAGAAKIRMSLSLSSPQLQGGRTIDVQGTGVIDGTNSEFDFTMGSLGSMQEILLKQGGDYVIYMQMPQLSARLPAGKHWVKLDVSKLGKASGLDLSKLMSGSQFQPTDVLSMLKSEGATIRNLGSATVDGTATTHYRVTLDTAKALQAKGLTSPLLAGAAATLPASIPANVWIGKDGLVRQVRIELAAAQGRMTMTMNLFDYGTDVPVAAPPSSEVFDATQLAQQGMSGYSG